VSVGAFNGRKDETPGISFKLICFLRILLVATLVSLRYDSENLNLNRGDGEVSLVASGD
jgi:hypothetical protein